MRTNLLGLAIAAMFVSTAALAQDFRGTWQGSIQLQTESRYQFSITKSVEGTWSGIAIVGDDWGEKLKAEDLRVEGNRIQFSVKIPGADSTYNGQLSADGNSISGQWAINQRPLALNLARATSKTEWKEAPYGTRFVTVDKDIKLEVLDWGGKGRPMVLLAGLGNTAHVFGDFAAKLAQTYHVYGITRRGFGESSAPPVPTFPVTKVGDNSYDLRPVDPALNPYDANRLGDDVADVVYSLKLRRPILVAHSLGGEELSSVASRHPEAASALVYLDAFYDYAYADGTSYDSLFSAEHPWHLTLPPGHKLDVNVNAAALLGMHEYRALTVPALAICAVPQVLPPALRDNPGGISVYNAQQQKIAERLDRIAPALPMVRIVRIPNSAHYVFRSNEAEVLKQIEAFVADLNR